MGLAQPKFAYNFDMPKKQKNEFVNPFTESEIAEMIMGIEEGEKDLAEERFYTMKQFKEIIESW